ncbi:hypothetical protein [Streptomyces stackebrandtii]|uniref:hypothetical protein n=1 Tax=Streptomyces stackebrandtii TaxID=3051177 RepID=UPI0028DB97AC|nr:hypothetical protein [Streptomyces sp. DSM 40976]
MEDRKPQQEQATAAVRKRIQDSFALQGLMSHLGAHLAHIGPGRTLTVCQLEVYGVQNDGTRKLVANGQQTLIRTTSGRPASPTPSP